MSSSRRLAAIMFTDIAGYTALMGEDEKIAFELLKKNRKLQKPMFNLLSTPVKDKKIIIYEGGHLVLKSELMKESLLWFDKYLGAVK